MGKTRCTCLFRIRGIESSPICYQTFRARTAGTRLGLPDLGRSLADTLHTPLNHHPYSCGIGLWDTGRKSRPCQGQPSPRGTLGTWRWRCANRTPKGKWCTCATQNPPRRYFLGSPCNPIVPMHRWPCPGRTAGTTPDLLHSDSVLLDNQSKSMHSDCLPCRCRTSGI